MEGNYPVMFGSKTVGKVQIRKQGLYYHIDCRCQLSSNAICRLQASGEEQKENLGILVPEEEGFCLRTKVPVKKLGNGMFSFQLAPKYDKGDASFAPIYPEEPFAYISRLKGAYLARQNGQAGIYL